MKGKLARFIVEELLNQTGQTVGDDDDLLTSGLVDSIGIMSLVFFIEQEFKVEVPPGDVTIENFGSIGAIEGYLTARTS